MTVAPLRGRLSSWLLGLLLGLMLLGLLCLVGCCLGLCLFWKLRSAIFGLYRAPLAVAAPVMKAAPAPVRRTFPVLRRVRQRTTPAITQPFRYRTNYQLPLADQSYATLPNPNTTWSTVGPNTKIGTIEETQRKIVACMPWQKDINLLSRNGGRSF